jgi:predicted RNA methylase
VADPRILFVKAALPGGAAADLFAEPVQVKGYVTSHGQYVAPHVSTRKKRHDQPAQHVLFGGDLFAPRHDAPVRPAEVVPAPAPAPHISPPHEQASAPLLAGLPDDAVLEEGRGPLGRGKWRVRIGSGPFDTTNLFDTQAQAVAAGRDLFQRRGEEAAAKVAREARDKEIAAKLLGGEEITDADLRHLDLRVGKSSEFSYLSPVVQRLFGITKPKVRAAMGSALRAATNDGGTVSWWANPRKALANAAAWVNAGGKPPAPAPAAADLGDLGAAADQHAARTSAATLPWGPDVAGLGDAAIKRARIAANEAALALLEAKTDAEMTDADRAVLARYSGNGGCGASLNEFYTDPAVAASMWDMLAACGFRGGDVLEPSAGTGVFLHTAPAGAHVQAVELDAVSARIANILHTGAGHAVQNSSLERFATQDGRLFDAVIGNVPFGVRGGFLRDDKKDITTAERYFVDTGLDKLRDGGLLALIVPTGVMDSKNGAAFRRDMLCKAQLVSCHRLPNTAFAASNTGVTSDILILRKRPQEVAGALGTLNQAQLKAVGVLDSAVVAGTYMTDGPGTPGVMGTLEPGWRAKAGMGDDITVTGSMQGIPAALSAWRPADDALALRGPAMADIMGVLDADGKKRALNAALKPPYHVARVGDVKTVDGVRYVLTGEPPRWHLAQVGVPAAVHDAQAIADMLDELRDGRANDPRLVRAQVAEALDQYITLHGVPSRNKDLAAWLKAPSLPMQSGASAEDHAARVTEARHRTARMLGAVNDDGTYSDLITGRLAQRAEAGLDTVAEKLANELGAFDADQLAGASGKSRADVLDHLIASPDYAVEADGTTWTTLDNYIAGDMWAKYDAATAASKSESVAAPYQAKYAAQAAALEAAIAPQSLEDVEIVMSSGFITPELLTAWLAAKAADYNKPRGGVFSAHKMVPAVVTVDDGVYEFQTKPPRGAGNSWFRDHDIDLIERYLNRTGVRKKDKDAVDALNEKFRAWLLGSEYRDEVEERYNRTYRGFRGRVYSEAPIQIPGLNPTLDINGYHYAGIRWALEQGKGIIAADVGLGKTGRSLMLARLAKATGQATKPTFVVPKSVLANWMSECEFWFPGSKVLVIGESYQTNADGTLKLDARNRPIPKADDEATRRRKYHLMQQNDYDFILISQPSWNDLDIDPARKQAMQDDEFWNRRAEKLRGMKDKALNKAKSSHDQKEAAREFTKKEGTVYFEDLGIDMLIVDEGHCFPAGTLVDGKPIESYRPGDLVRAFDHATGKIVMSRVLDLQVRAPRDLVRVTLGDGSSIVCTGNHPFFTPDGYVYARDLTTEQVVYKNLFGGSLDTGICGADQEGARLPEPLQDRPGTSDLAHRNRSGRKVASITYPAGPGPAEGGFFAAVGVARVEVLEPTGDGTFGGLCRGGVVYNIGVETHHNYLAEGVLVHNCYKNLFSAKNRFGESPKFLGGSGQSNRAIDTYYKTRVLREAHDGRGVFMLTATPTKNSPLEVYSMLAHIAPEAFEKLGIRDAEAFLDRFCTFELAKVYGTNGEFKEQLITSGFKNLGELREIMRRYIDRKTAEDVGLKLPDRNDVQHVIDMSPEQEAVYEGLRKRAEQVGRPGSDGGGEDHIFSIISDMGKASIDLGLLDPRHAKAKSPKIEAAADAMKAGLAEGGQVVFCDTVPVHEKIAAACVARGIPRGRIAIINGDTCKSSDARQAICERFNAGDIDVVIGGAAMEEGLNLQKRTADLHHLDLPWNQGGLQQRNGRAVRQGNKKASIRVHTYLARGSFDAVRYQTIMGKKDWSDLLWNGGDRVENQAADAKLSREEQMIMLSKDPVAARAAFDADRTAAELKMTAEERGKAVREFERMAEMRRSLAQLAEHAAKREGGYSAAADKTKRRLEAHIGRIEVGLRANPYFLGKNLIDGKTPALFCPTTGQPWAVGQGIELAGGAGGPVHWGPDPTKWVVTGIDPVKQALKVRMFGAPHTTLDFDLADMKAGVKPVEHSDEAEAAYVAERKEAEAARRGAAVKLAEEGIAAKAANAKTWQDLHNAPLAVVEAAEPDIQARMKAAILDHSAGYMTHVPLVHKESGAASIHHSWDVRDRLGDHDLMLPTTANREKMLDAYVRHGLGRLVSTNTLSQSRKGYRKPGMDGVYPGFSGHSESANQWAHPIRHFFGADGAKEAEQRLQSAVVDNIAAAPDFGAAMRAAQPTANLTMTYQRWPPPVLAALHAAAARAGVLGMPMKEAAPPDGTYKAALHPDLVGDDIDRRKTVGEWLRGHGYTAPAEAAA